MVPKVEPNTDPQVIQARNQVLWGQPSLSNAPSQQQQHQQPQQPPQLLSHCKSFLGSFIILLNSFHIFCDL